MAVANYNRKILDLKRWTVMPTPSPVSTSAGVFVVSSRLAQQRQLWVFSATVHYLYYPFEDGWVQVPSGALAGTFGAGSCGTSGCVGPTGTATAGTASTLTTNLTLARNLAGYEIEITAGPNAGLRRTIARNTIGANAIITTTQVFPTPITSSSVYRLLTPRWYVLNAGTLASGSFRVYCFALNSWITLAQAGLPATWSTDGRMVATSSLADTAVPVTFASGTATAGGAATLTHSGKTWTANQWANMQVRITSGAGAGQIRTIASNTSDTLTVSAAWTTQPDATSAYVIEGNDDHIYLMGNNAVTLYRYSISANTWSTLNPGAARAAAPGAGMSAHWVWDVDRSDWNDESSIINGRRIYSFRGAGSQHVDYYDIAANTWVSTLPFAPNVETFAAGSKYVYAAGHLYIHKDATGRWFRFSFADQAMVGFTANVYPGGVAVVGDTAFDVVEPETGVRFLHMLLNTSAVHMRCMIV